MDEEIRKLILEVLHHVARATTTDAELNEAEHKLRILRSQLTG